MSALGLNVKGYTTPRSFVGFQIPIPLQSLAIRNYCSQRGFVFNHHVVENITPDSFLVLQRAITDVAQYQAIAMCSIGQLPSNQYRREQVLRHCVDAGVSVHFLFEQLVVDSHEQIPIVEQLLNLVSLHHSRPIDLSAFSVFLRNP